MTFPLHPNSCTQLLPCMSSGQLKFNMPKIELLTSPPRPNTQKFPGVSHYIDGTASHLFLSHSTSSLSVDALGSSYIGVFFTTCTGASLKSWIAAVTSENKVSATILPLVVCPPHSTQMIFSRKGFMSAMAPSRQMAPLHTLNKIWIPLTRPFIGWPLPTSLATSCQTFH